jgi:hypothetical protein
LEIAFLSKECTLEFQGERRKLMYAVRTNIFPSFVLLLMGTMDCVTTVIGVLFYGATETNPMLVGVVNSNIAVFTVLKLTATFCIAGTYILAKRMLDRTVDKSTRSYRYGNTFVKAAYAGLVLFLIAVVVNNFLILMA